MLKELLRLVTKSPYVSLFARTYSIIFILALLKDYQEDIIGTLLLS